MNHFFVTNNNGDENQDGNIYKYNEAFYVVKSSIKHCSFLLFLRIFLLLFGNKNLV